MGRSSLAQAHCAPGCSPGQEAMPQGSSQGLWPLLNVAHAFAGQIGPCYSLSIGELGAQGTRPWVRDPEAAGPSAFPSGPIRWGHPTPGTLPLPTLHSSEGQAGLGHPVAHLLHPRAKGTLPHKHPDGFKEMNSEHGRQRPG